MYAHSLSYPSYNNNNHAHSSPKSKKVQAATDLYILIDAIRKRIFLRVLENIQWFNFNSSRKQFVKDNIDAGFRMEEDSKKHNFNRKRKSKTVDTYAEYSRRKLLDDIIKKLKLKSQLREDLSESSDHQLLIRINNLQKIINEYYIENSFEKSKISQLSNKSQDTTKLNELTQELSKIKGELTERQKRKKVQNIKNNSVDTSKYHKGKQEEVKSNHNKHSGSPYGLSNAPFINKQSRYQQLGSRNTNPQNNQTYNRLHQQYRPLSQYKYSTNNQKTNHNPYSNVNNNKHNHLGSSRSGNSNLLYSFNKSNKQYFDANARDYNGKQQFQHEIVNNKFQPHKNTSEGDFYQKINQASNLTKFRPLQQSGYTQQNQNQKLKFSIQQRNSSNKDQMEHHFNRRNNKQTQFINKNNKQIGLNSRKQISYSDPQTNIVKLGYARINILSPRPYNLKRENQNSRESYKQIQRQRLKTSIQ